MPEKWVSRSQEEVVFEGGEWRLRDLKSANGIYVNGQLVQSLSITDNATVRLGNVGPVLTFSLEKPPVKNAESAGTDTTIADYINRYFEPAKKDAQFGTHTMFVRQAFAKVQTRQKKKYWVIIAALAVLVSSVRAYAFYEHRQAQRQRKLAEDLFYNINALDVDIAGLELGVMESQSQRGKNEIQTFQARRKEMQKSYDQFLNSLHVYNKKLSEQDRLILRVARIFGEAEMNMPPGFVPEVHSDVVKGNATDRLAYAVSTAVKNG